MRVEAFQPSSVRVDFHTNAFFVCVLVSTCISVHLCVSPRPGWCRLPRGWLVTVRREARACPAQARLPRSHHARARGPTRYELDGEWSVPRAILSSQRTVFLVGRSGSGVRARGTSQRPTHLCSAWRCCSHQQNRTSQRHTVDSRIHPLAPSLALSLSRPSWDESHRRAPAPVGRAAGGE